MQIRRIMASLAVGLLATAGFATGASAATPPSKPVVTASVTSQDGATTEIDYTVNRGAKQIASITYSLSGGDPLAVSAPTSGKSSSTGSFTVTAADGENTLTVTVNLTDGGTATSNQVKFTYTAVDLYPEARAGCEAFTGGVFTVGDDPGTTGGYGPERFYCLTAEESVSFDYANGAFRIACLFVAGGNVYEYGPPAPPATGSVYRCF